MAPTPEDLCVAHGAVSRAYSSFIENPTPQGVRFLVDNAALMFEAAGDLEMSDSVRAGLAWVHGAFTGLEDDATAEELAAVDGTATEEDIANVEAFGAYIATECNPKTVAP